MERSLRITFFTEEQRQALHEHPYVLEKLNVLWGKGKTLYLLENGTFQYHACPVCKTGVLFRTDNHQGACSDCEYSELYLDDV